MKVLFIWKVDDQLTHYIKEHITELDDIELIFAPDKEELTLINAAKGVQVIVGWRPTQKLLNALPDLKYIINPGVGVQHLLPEFSSHFIDNNITLINSHGNAFATAQHGMAMLLSLCNRLKRHHAWMQSGEWRVRDKRLRSVRLKNKNVGLMGFGHIGQQVHKMLQPYECKYHIYKHKKTEIENATVYTKKSLEEFLKNIDVLFITLPSTDATKNLINENNIGYLGKQVLLVNIGRGDVIEESTLFNALKNKTIDSAAIDVWYNYKPEKDKDDKQFPYKLQFHELENIILSPHRAASPFDELTRWDDVIENIKNIKSNPSAVTNVVDITAGY